MTDRHVAVPLELGHMDLKIKMMNYGLFNYGFNQGGTGAMKRFWFWLQRKRRMKKRDCGDCCLNCKFFGQCWVDGEF